MKGEAAEPPPAPPSEPKQAEKGVRTVTMRIPERLGQMLDLIALRRIRGWKTPAAVLSDDECPLEAWLIPYFNLAVAETVKIQEELKSEQE